MITATVYFRGLGVESRALPGLPAVGHYLRHAGALWRVEAVVVDTVPDVYVVRVGDCRAAELVEAWAAWAEPAAAGDKEGEHNAR